VEVAQEQEIVPSQVSSQVSRRLDCGQRMKKEKGESIKEAKDLGELWKRQ
jgi:hypothetical protein